jgi:hypothetical protein
MGLQRLHQTNKQMLTRSSCKVLLTCKESCILHTRDTPFRPILRVSCMLDSNINIVIIPGNIGKIKKSMKS